MYLCENVFVGMNKITVTIFMVVRAHNLEYIMVYSSRLCNKSTALRIHMKLMILKLQILKVTKADSTLDTLEDYKLSSVSGSFQVLPKRI